MSTRKLNIAVISLGFGAEFIPLWQKHPHTTCYAICQRNADKLREVGDYWGVEKRCTNYEELLKDPNVDAVHINSPIPNHGEQSIAALMRRCRRWSRSSPQSIAAKSSRRPRIAATAKNMSRWR